MWLAICADRSCAWERGTYSHASAQVWLAWHTEQTGHGGATVDIAEPDEAERRDTAVRLNHERAA